MDARLADKLPEIMALCERYGVAQLELFGSATGATFDPASSDYDFLLKLAPAHAPNGGLNWRKPLSNC